MEARYLLDTNVVSELSRKKPNRDVIDFFAAHRKLEVSTILFHELTYGLETCDPSQKPRLTTFVAAMRERFGRTAIPVDFDIAETAGLLRAAEKVVGRILTVSDSLIAATAATHGLVLVTRNVKDFAGLGLDLINPFEG